MKNLKFKFLAVIMAVFAVISLKAQTVDEIIAKSTDAMGGKDKIKAITSIYMENSMEVMGNESLSTIVILNGKGAKTKSDFNGQSMIQCYTDKGGWAINPMSGSSDATVMPNEQYQSGKNQIFIGQSFMDYASKGYKVELVGKEKVKNADVYKIKLITSENVIMNYYIDATTFYVIQTSASVEMMGQKMEVTTQLSDFQKTDYGYVLPKTTTISYGDQFSMVMKLKKVEINKPVDPTIFDLGNLK